MPLQVACSITGKDEHSAFPGASVEQVAPFN